MTTLDSMALEIHKEEKDTQVLTIQCEVYANTGPSDMFWEHRRQPLMVEVTGKTPRGEELIWK